MARTASRTASIRDVAALAEVSVPTVSRFLNNPSKVSEEKRERISQAISMLGYRPNPVARALVHRQMPSVAVFTTNTTLYGPSLVFEGIEDSAREEGLPLSICVLNGQDRSDLRKSAQLYLDQHPSGVIMLDFDNLDIDMTSLLPENLPAVTVAGDAKKTNNQVTLGAEQGGYEVTKYLLGLGHKTVIHVALPHEGVKYSRMAGWHKACEEYNVPIYAPIISEWNPESGVEIGHRLAADDTVTAIFAGNDVIALGIIRGLNEAGKKVPEDVSVVGFDDQPLSKIWTPKLTTYRMNFKEGGKQAFKMLRRQMSENMEQVGDNCVNVAGELILRDSTTRI
ncbi:LacI family DNA-binding transcriptional regulator [Bifidobacterium miconisargentati]|uniref:LacI family DNA-binding transcriptional regulator n=1 Tax=Bifidobacterium miconisargentati TaxID=2834437 RepID=UPI001BDD18A2|nr:LacI family DNA-binding transcriptional regulator [Bifidobacterium miconisargentati]MBW3091156.1 LacI family DNA-binding transcriptional regulator [Bifidobacterium miconisargentati]